MVDKEYFDTVIIGAGPAGIACALELHDSSVTCLLLEKGSKLGCHLSDITNTIKNFPSGFYENGESLRTSMAALVKRVGCNYRVNQEISNVDLSQLKLTANDLEIQARTILLATGSRRRQLGLPDESHFSNDIVYDINHASPQHFAGQAVAVIGGGDSATLDALELTQLAARVYLIYRSNKLSARPDIIQKVLQNKKIELLLNTQVLSLSRNHGLQSLHICSQSIEKQISITRLVVKIGEAPNTELFAGQVALLPSGHIIIDRNCATSAANVFAAGDVTESGYPRLSMAVGQGIQAAYAIRKTIERQPTT